MVQLSPARPRRRRFALWVAVSALAAVAVLGSTGGVALAATNLNQTTPISSSDPNFQGSATTCAGFDTSGGAVLWHFVLTQTSAGTGTILTTQFASAGTINTPATLKTGNTLHWFVTTPTADTLLSASTTANGKQLNLSHICSGGTTTTTSTTTSSSTTASG